MTCHAFNIEDAKQYGVDSAIILHNIRFWLDHNKANGTHINDGYVWTYNSARAFSELFPYWSGNKIQKLLKKLEGDGVIITGNYNKAGYDKTKWYTLPEYSLQPNGGMDSAKRINPSGQTAKPIPDIKTHEISDEINTEHFSKEKRIDVFSLLGHEYCVKAYEFLGYINNAYTGPLTERQWELCEEKLREVLDRPCDCDELITNIYRDRGMERRKSVSLPYILMAFTDCEEFAHLALNCTNWLDGEE